MNLRPKIALVLSALLLVAVTWLDVYSSDELRITSLYLIPILLVTWNNGRRWGYLFAAVSVAILLMVDLQIEATESKHLYFRIDTVGRFLSYVVVIIMASKLRAAYESERRLARTDGLTHLMNRRAFYSSLEVELARIARHARPFALLYIDCDNFKQVNDTMGHREGDKLLLTIAETMRNNVRKGDLVARLGGDEFAIFFPETDEKGLVSVVSDLTSKLDRAVASRYPQVSFSVGIAVFLNTTPSLEEVVMRADQLMYQVKTTGKNGLLQQVF
jgi:diguanylate cyclase (GGDEF)-like protein